MQSDFKSINKHLNDELIPFWDKNAVDKLHGGFLTNFDEQGKEIDMLEKYLNTQCRMIWWFSHLNMISPSESHVEKAKQGVDFLIQYLWDTVNEGWRWKVKSNGSPLDDEKVVYGQSFAIYSLADYYLATVDERGLTYGKNIRFIAKILCRYALWRLL